MNYDGMFNIPGMGDEFYNYEQQVYWDGWNKNILLGAILSSTLVDTGNTSYTSILRPGLAVGMITSTKKVEVWNPYATDGTQRLLGFLLPEMKMTYLGVAAEKTGVILVAGNVYGANVLIPGETTAGIAGKNYEFLLRNQMNYDGRFKADDDLGQFDWKCKEVAASATLTRLDHRTQITNVGASGTVTLTLPSALPGFELELLNTAGQIIAITTASGSQVLTGGSAAASLNACAANANVLTRVRAVRDAATPTYKYVIEV